MASITSLSNSASSIYGTRNVLSGLASGMDTESMIENAVSGIKLKIQNLQKKRTKVEWQQEAYRSIIDKAVNFTQKYTSYSSKTNLLSSSFFNNAVKTTAQGTYADKISATGKSSSDIKINSVRQLAKAATYSVSGLGGLSGGDISESIQAGKPFDIAGKTTVSTVSGSLTFQYGGTNGTTFDISFDELEDLNEVEVLNADGTVKTDASDSEKLAQAIQNKLSEVTYNYTKNGFQEATTADKAIKVDVDALGRISFSDGLGNGNSVKISSASGKIKAISGETGISGIQGLTTEVDTTEYLKDKDLSITYNGVTKKISMSDVLDRAAMGNNKDNAKFKDALQKELDDAFGTGKIRVKLGTGDNAKMSFEPTGEGSTLSINGVAAEAMGFAKGDSNYINTSRKLTDLLGDKSSSIFTEANRLKGTFTNYNGKPIQRVSPNGSIYYLDDKGNRVDKDGYRVTNEGKAIYDFEINGAHVNVTEDSTLESLMTSINSNAEAGVKVSYSKLTNEFKFTATETGANSRIQFGKLGDALFGVAASGNKSSDSFFKSYGIKAEPGEKKNLEFQIGVSKITLKNMSSDDSMNDIVNELNESIALQGYKASYNDLSGQIMITDKSGKMVDFQLNVDNKEVKPQFSANYTTGQDAIMDLEINGKQFENFTRSSNVFDIDGMTITAKGTFNEDGKGIDKDGKEIEPITFTTTSDSDKLVEAIASMINDYNEMVTEIKSAYSTMPAEKSNGSRYEPLTAEQEDEYSESELKAYNEKAKQGILFADSTLNSMYNKLRSAITPGGEDGQILREIGITTSYNNGLTTLTLDEDKLRAALDSDPDKVRSAFTKTKEGGSASDGLMQTMQNTLNTYVKTTGEPKGVLITRAGSIKAPTSLNSNSLKSQMDNIDNQIERWQDKMADQIDRYTTKFSKLEQLIAEMNSQSSALMGLMGGSSGGY